VARGGWQASKSDIAAIVAARHGDPFSVLGLHQSPEGAVIRAFVPGAEHLSAEEQGGARLELARRHADGFFEGLWTGRSGHLVYRLFAANQAAAWILHDPYMFGPVLGPLDDYLLVEGTHEALCGRMGAHPMQVDGIAGVHFAVWAPNARRVSVVGDFNAWDGRRHQMRKRIDSGIWEIFAPDVGEGAVYKFEILAADGALLPLKADPFGFAAELRPSTASIVARTDRFEWTDFDYLAARSARNGRRSPVAIYEVHLGSWRRGQDNRFLTYGEIADQLIPYVIEMGFTHIELLPVSEHPLDASWGYQPIGLFAPTARHGAPSDFAHFIDRAHQAGIGVILDWVPAHFPTDPHGLARFDGTALYENADPRRGFHPDWNTAIYEFGRREVANFLIASALYWFDRFHIDGLRVDAVASMLYLDYSRKTGEWLPNAEGGNQNSDAVAFLRRVNMMVYGQYPGAMMIAEDSTAWPGVCLPVENGGLGFGFKWNLGWMHDTLDYLGFDPLFRRWHHDKLTFGLLYAFSENFILPLSHDEVVHGKGSILGRMPGDDWRQFATVRAYYGFMWGYPGKKLLFMGQEFAQRREWDFDGQIGWGLLEHESHRGVQACVRDLNRLYREEPSLHVHDCEPEGFRWLVVDDAAQSVYAWIRLGNGADPPIAVICNFTSLPRYGYRIGLPYPGVWQEVLNTDAVQYGGSGIGNLGSVNASGTPSHGYSNSSTVTLPPLATVYFRYQPASGTLPGEPRPSTGE